MKIKFQNLIFTSSRNTQSYPRLSIVYTVKCGLNSSGKPMHHILKYKLSTLENVDVVQVINMTKKRKRRFSTLIWPPAQIQDLSYSRVSCFFFWKCEQNFGGHNFNKIVIFSYFIELGAKFKIPKHYYAST